MGNFSRLVLDIKQKTRKQPDIILGSGAGVMAGTGAFGRVIIRTYRAKSQSLIVELYGENQHLMVITKTNLTVKIRDKSVMFVRLKPSNTGTRRAVVNLSKGLTMDHS